MYIYVYIGCSVASIDDLDKIMSICANPGNKRFLIDDSSPGALCLQALNIMLLSDELEREKNKMRWDDTSCKHLTWSTLRDRPYSPGSDSSDVYPYQRRGIVESESPPASPKK